MQILANALPGFREIRGPVVAGYLWLLFLWLLVLPDFDRRPDNDLSGAIYDVGQDAGRLAVVVGVSVAAYLIGSISQEISNALRALYGSGGRVFAEDLTGDPTAPERGLSPRVETKRGEPGEVLVGDRLSLDISEVGPNLVWLNDLGPRSPAHSHIIELYNRGVERITQVSNDEEVDPRILQPLIDELYERARLAYDRSRRELEIPATLLVGDQPELFAEVDRIRAEAELRLAVTPPLIGLIVLSAERDTQLWLIALLAVFLLFRQGMKRDTDWRSLIADAMAVGKVNSKSLSELEAWVRPDDGGLAQAIEHAVAYPHSKSSRV